MTLKELQDALNDAVISGYPLDTQISVDMLDSVTKLEETYWQIELDRTGVSSPLSLSINVGG